MEISRRVERVAQPSIQQRWGVGTGAGGDACIAIDEVVVMDLPMAKRRRIAKMHRR